MADQSNKGAYDIFIANSTYPDVRSVFARLKPLDQIKDECFIVLDTNVLLTPYTIGQEDLLEQIRKTFKPLSTQKRLIIPGQVAREFAKHRANKLTELYQQLSKKQVPSMHRGKYPLLSSLDDYKEIVRLEEEIDKKLAKYRQAYKKTIDDLLSRIQEWRWNDPVTLLYSEIFDEDTIIDPPIDKEALQTDLEHRLLYNIPPAYKDRSKDDRGIGDLLIWHTILEIGKSKKKSIIFVSGDEKSDWYLRSEGRALYPRYELVDEFRRHSEGQTFHLVKFSYFLELFGASEKVVQQVQHAESFLQQVENFDRNEEIRDQTRRERRINSILLDISNISKELEKIKAEKQRLQNELTTAEIQKEGELIPVDTLYPGDALYPTNIESTIEQLRERLRETHPIERDLEWKLSVASNALKHELAELGRQIRAYAI